MTYWLVFLLSLFVLLKYSRVDYDKNLFCKIFPIVIFFLGTFRDTTIGTDIWLSGGGGYYYIWKSPLGSVDADRLEVGFLYLTSLLKSIHNSYYFYYGAIYAITIGLYFFAAKRMKINPAVFLAIFLLLVHLAVSFNAYGSETSGLLTSESFVLYSTLTDFAKYHS